MIEIQGNVSALLEEMLGTDSAPQEHRAMIEATVEELTPFDRHQAGVSGAGRVAGDDLPSPAAAGAQAAQAAADTGPGAERARAPAGARRTALRAVRRRLSGGDLGDAARQGRLPVLASDDVPDPRRQPWRSPQTGAIQLTHPAYANPGLLAERPSEVLAWGISRLRGQARSTWFYL